MAYSTSSTPLPPPPPGVNYQGAREFDARARLSSNASRNLARNGVAPVNQMSNGFGGRQGGNPNMAVTPQVSGGNRTSMHVATPGNNNVSYASESLLQSAGSLYGRRNATGIAPANGMSYGFIKNTAARPSGVAPPPPPPPTNIATPIGVPDPAGPAPEPFVGSGYDAANDPAQRGYDTSTHDAPGVLKAPIMPFNGMSTAAFNGQFLYLWDTKKKKNVAHRIDGLTRDQILKAVARDINKPYIAAGWGLNSAGQLVRL